MKTKIPIIILTLCSAFSANAISDAIYRWVDEKGKVHFGEAVPPRYSDVAEEVENQPINTVAPEPEIKRQNDTAIKKLKIQDAKRKEKQAAAKKSAPANQENDSGLTREYCRDNFITVKQRTECFKRAQNIGANSVYRIDSD